MCYHWDNFYSTCICIKTDTFSARAWQGHDCVLMGLKTLLLANFQRVERLKQARHQINYMRLKWITGAFNTGFERVKIRRVRLIMGYR